MYERSEWADEATAALSTPATEPEGYVEGLEAACRFADHVSRDLGWHRIYDVTGAALAARPAPQPAADTRVVTDAMIVEIWERAQQYDPDELFIELVRAIIGTATPSDKIELATRLITAARAEWLAENDPKDGTDCVTPYDEWFYK